jgi:hypothetical protein
MEKIRNSYSVYVEGSLEDFINTLTKEGARLTSLGWENLIVRSYEDGFEVEIQGYRPMTEHEIKMAAIVKSNREKSEREQYEALKKKFEGA